MMFTPSGRILIDSTLTDGTFIIPGTVITTDGELLFEFIDHTIPVYALSSTLQPKAIVGSYLSYTLALECTNNADPGLELNVTIPIPEGFSLIETFSDSGTYNPSTGKWTVRMDSYNQVAYLELIVEVVSAGTQSQTTTLDGLDVSLTETCITTLIDPDGGIVLHEPDLQSYSTVIANMKDGQEYTLIAYHQNQDSYISGEHGDAENGSTDGYTAVNGLEYTNTLDSDVAECTNASKFGKNTGSESISAYTSFEYAERNLTSIIVQCPAVNDNEGSYITVSGLTVGHTYTAAVCVYALPDIGIGVYIPGPGAYTSFTPGGDVQEKRLTFTATATTHDVAIAVTSKVNTVFSIALLMICEGEVGSSPIVLPGETGQTVRVENVSEPAGQMRVIYTGNNYLMPFDKNDVTELRLAGATDIINMGYANLLDNYENVKDHVNTSLALFHEQGLKYHMGISPFRHIDNSEEDPADSTYIADMVAQIQQLFIDCPTLDGISFDDFIYPAGLHNPANEAAEEAALTAFIIAIRNAMRSAKPTALLSGAIMPLDHDQGNDISSFTDEFDVSILMCTYRFRNNVSSYIKDVLDITLPLCGDNIVIPTVLTFYSDADQEDYWPVQQLVSDMYDILQMNPQGVGIFYWLFHPEGLYIPVEDAYGGNRSIRVIARGRVSGEGVKLSIPEIVTGTSFRGDLPVKTHDGLVFKAGYGVSVLSSFEGTGVWESLHIAQTASEKYVYVQTSIAQGAIFYIDKYVFDNGSVGIKNNRVSVLNADVYENLVYANAATGTNQKGTVDGFSSYGTTLESTTEWALNAGERSLKVICHGTQSGERAWGISRDNGVEGVSYAGSSIFKGTEGDTFLIVLQLLSSPYTTVATSQEITATGDVQIVDVAGVCPESGKKLGILIRKTNTNTNPFYIARCGILEGSEVPEGEMDMVTGNLISGKEYIGSGATVQDSIEKLTCTFIHDSTKELHIRRYGQYKSISTSATNRWYGLCLVEGIEKEYMESKSLLSNPVALLDDSSTTDLELEGGDESAEYIFSRNIPPLPGDKNPFFTGIQLLINSFADPSSSIQVQMVSSNGNTSNIESAFIESTGQIRFGDLAYLWSLTDNDIQGKTLQIKFKVINPSSITQELSYSNLRLYLYYQDDLTRGKLGFSYKGIHSRNYNLILSDDDNPLGLNKKISTLSVEKTDGVLITDDSAEGKEIVLTPTLVDYSLPNAQLILNSIAEWLSSEKNAYNIPTPEELILDYNPSMVYMAVLSKEIDITKKHPKITLKISFLVPNGVALNRTPKITGPNGINRGSKLVRPIISLEANGADSIIINNDNSYDLFTINSNIPSGTIITIDNEKQTVTDENGTDYTEQISPDSIWIGILPKTAFNFTCTGGSIRSVQFQEGF